MEITTIPYELQSSTQLNSLFGESNAHINDNNAQLTQLKYTLSTDPDIEDQMKMTKIPYLIDHNRNANEISPISSGILSLDEASDIDTSSDASYIIPLKILLPVEHVHKMPNSNSFERYNYILLNVDDVSYHDHIHSDNPEILFPLNHSPEHMTSASLDGDNEATTNIQHMLDSDEKDNINSDVIQTDKNVAILVDSQGYHYELKDHFKIMDDENSAVIEFDEIAAARPKIIEQPNNEMSKQSVTINDAVASIVDSPKTSISVDQYEQHYAKIFTWLHYHL